MYHFDKTCGSLNPYVVNYQENIHTHYHSVSSLSTSCWNSGSAHSRCFSSQSTVIQRNPKFSTINTDDISHFKKILGERGVIEDEDTLNAVNMDWMRKYKGASKLMLQPRSTEEVDFLSLRFIYFLNGRYLCYCF